jgi:uncharacterized protein
LEFKIPFTKLHIKNFNMTENSDKLRRILSLDGGGIRGIMTGQILVALEEKLNKKYFEIHGVQAEKPIRLGQYFDFVAGTSTGGILACILLCRDDNDIDYPRFSAKEAVGIYMKYGKEIFQPTFSGKLPGFLSGVGGSKFAGERIETILKEYLGNRPLSEMLKPCLITSYDIQQRKAVFFTSHDAKEKDNADFPMWQVARSTSAAPTYFPPAKAKAKDDLEFHTIDGGLFANNPTMCAVIEAMKIFRDEKNKLSRLDNLFILSIGTGEIRKKYDYAEAVKWGILRWISPIIDIMMTAVSETVDYQLRKLYKTLGQPDQYYRIMPELGDANPEMDDTTDKNLEALRQAGIQCAYTNDDCLSLIAEKLILNA